MKKQDIDEKRRIKFYRSLTSLDNWEMTLRTLSQASRSMAVWHLGTGHPEAANYYQGRADGIEELLEKCRVTKSIPEEPEQETVNE